MSVSSDADAVDFAWFYEQQGQRQGPTTQTQIVELLRDARIGPNTPVWRSGFSDWMTLERTELAQYVNRSSPPPLSGAHVDNNITWTLAIAPILGLFLEYFLAGAMMSNEYVAEEAVADGKFFLVTVALNVLLSYLDEKRIRAAGHDTSKFRGLTWLVPVYLFQRAKLLKQTPAYFWVWLATFVLTLIW